MKYKIRLIKLMECGTFREVLIESNRGYELLQTSFSTFVIDDKFLQKNGFVTKTSYHISSIVELRAMLGNFLLQLKAIYSYYF